MHAEAWFEVFGYNLRIDNRDTCNRSKCHPQDIIHVRTQISMILSFPAQTQILWLCFMLWSMRLPQTKLDTVHGVAIYLTHTARTFSLHSLCVSG